MTEDTLEYWKNAAMALAETAAGSDGAHDLSHLHRVWRNARELLEAHPEADRLVVMAACYLHDLVNLPKNDPLRHTASTQSARVACGLMEAKGFPASLLGKLAHAIEAHSFSAAIAPTSIEAKIVQDADRLDALGAVGLARMFYVAGRMGIRLAHPQDPLAQARTLDDQLYSLDHIDAKLATLPGTMQTARGRALANERLAELIAFRRRFAAEWAE